MLLILEKFSLLSQMSEIWLQNILPLNDISCGIPITIPLGKFNFDVLQM